MAFRASKIRQRQAPEPVGLGKPLIPNEAVRIWYNRQLDALAKAMLADYKSEIAKVMQKGTMREFYAQDASPSDLMKKLMSRLDSKWKDIYRGFAKQTAKEFTEKVDETSKASTVFSLSAAGVKEPRTTYNENVANTLQAASDFNNTLITGIQVDAHEKIYNAIMLSLTSPNPEEQGQKGITKALQETGDFTKNRAKLIARDQNSKLYSSLNVDRMKQNGIEKFKWMHSSAGKVPRESHLKMDGHIFSFDDPELWKEGGDFGLRKGDLGPPGWAINCRCRAVPVIE